MTLWTLSGDIHKAFAAYSGIGDFRAWAIRVNSEGKPIWEYVDGPNHDWNDLSNRGQRFVGAVDLPNQATLLCGVKLDADRSRIAFLVRVRQDGSIIDERQLQPSRSGDVAAIRCTKWSDGIAVVGAVTGKPAIGWLVKLDAEGNFVWEKFDDHYGYGDVAEALGGGLFMISYFGDTFLVKIDSEGKILGRQTLAGNEQHLIQTLAPPLTPRVALMMSTVETEVESFDEALGGPSHKRKLSNAGVKKALELKDGSVLIFGSQFRHGATTASITVLNVDGSSKDFTLEPAYQSPWFIDAVPSGVPNEFAMVRVVKHTATLAWISIH